MTKKFISKLCVMVLTSIPLSAYCTSSLQPTDFVNGVNLENDFKAYCLKMQTANSASLITVIDSTSRQSQGIRFESMRFEMKKNGIEKQPDCRAEREIINLVSESGKKITLSDSGFYPVAYCESPVRFSQAPIVYEMESIAEPNTKKRKLAVVEFVSSTLPCPDTDDIKFRRFLIFDLENPNSPLLDMLGDFVVPEIGNSPYRLHLVNVTKVLQSSFTIPAGKRPSEIELKNGKFSFNLVSLAKKDDLKQSVNKKDDKSRIHLNSIYSKDRKHVYYKTSDGSGTIEGADPSTFQLLSTEDESAYTKDAKKVFFFGKAVPSADAKTFVQMNERYGKDLNHVYHMESILTDADVSSFVAPFQSVWYAKDKNHVFSGKKILPLADPQTFSTGNDRSCGDGCTYRSEDKNYRFGVDDRVVQKTTVAK